MISRKLSVRPGYIYIFQKQYNNISDFLFRCIKFPLEILHPKMLCIFLGKKKNAIKILMNFRYLRKRKTNMVYNTSKRNMKLKNKRGYALTWDAILALGFVLVFLAAMFSLQYVKVSEVSTMEYKILHYVSEDVLDVLNKKGILDEIGEEFAVSNVSSMEENMTKLLNELIPEHIGYRLEIIEWDEDTANYGTYLITENLTRAGDMGEAEVLTHSARLLVGYGKEKPVYGDVARSYILLKGLNFTGEIWDLLECFGTDPCYCCAGPSCTAPTGDPTDCSAAELNNLKGDEVFCYAENCTVNLPNNVQGDPSDADPIAHIYCCGIIPGSGLRGNCTTTAGTTMKQGVDLMCCSEGCTVSGGNVMNNDVNLTCLGDNCKVDISSGNKFDNRVNIAGCGNYSDVYVNVDGHFMGPDSAAYCSGEDCTVYVRAEGSGKIEDSDIYCYGDGCSAEAYAENSFTNVDVYCCGAGCNATCSGAAGGCTEHENTGCPPTPLCDNTWCDEHCNISTDDELVYIPTPYTAPALKSDGSGNITVYYDKNGDNAPDGNSTIDINPGSNDTFDPCHDPNNCTAENILDSADFAFAWLMDLINTNDTDSNEGIIDPLVYYTTNSTNNDGDGGEDNPVDVDFGSSTLEFYVVHGSNIRSLWGPIKFKLIVWRD
ncbi:MAG: hypothetical protein A7316_00920 [Candidatus Altiarchaeales archaeon WOR_SM1_86-2]|nr:MAG: hypothetical protein A7316_00920 [Candidatus Altiarchaeales archaeon WOR_SM1_86-2]